MGRDRISTVVARQVISAYLDGLSMEEIAAKVKISKGSVWKIIHMHPHVIKFVLFHEIALVLATKGLNIRDFADIVRAGKLLERYGVNKHAAWRAVADIPIACFKLGIQPDRLISFLHRFEQFVIDSKVKNKSELYQFVRSSIESYFYCLQLKARLMEEIAMLEQQRQNTDLKNRLRQPFPGSDVGNVDLGKSLHFERAKNKELQRLITLNSITSPETAFTNKQSLLRLNYRFGLSLSSDEIFRRAMHLLKYTHKYPEFFMRPKMRRRRRKNRGSNIIE
jgi:predicted DNA-binding protein YlxM (UPF0122 family)